MSGSFNPALAIAQADYYASIGYHEGSNNDNIFTQWQTNGADRFDAWCDSFVCFCAYQAGYRFPWYSLFGERGDWNVGTHHQHAVRQGLWRQVGYVASPGDLVVFSWDVPDQHIEMVRGDDGGFSFATVGGNTSDMCAFRTRYRSNVVGFIALTQDSNQNANGSLADGATPPNYAVIGEPMHPNQPVDAYRLKAGDGAILLHGDGGIFCYGKAKFKGSIPGDKGYVPFDMTKEWAQSLLVADDESGYWILTSLGHVFSYGVPYHGGFAAQCNQLAIAVKIFPDPQAPGRYLAERADGRVMRPQ